MKLRLYKVSERHISFCKDCPFRDIPLWLPKSLWMVLDCDLWKETRRSKQTLLSPGLLPESASESFILCVQTEYNWVQIQEKCNHLSIGCFSLWHLDFLGRLQNTENLPSLKKSNFPYPQSIYSVFPLKSQNFQADFWNIHTGDDMCLTMRR